METRDLRDSWDAGSPVDTEKQHEGPAVPRIEAPGRPRYYQEFDPGIEVVQPSTLEVVPPRPRPAYSPPAFRWDKDSLSSRYVHCPETPQSAASSYSLAVPFDTAPLLPPTPPVPAERRILGLRRYTFYIILSISVLLAVLAIAAGVGVGIAIQKQSSSPASSPTPSVPPSTSSTAPSTLNLPMPTASAASTPSTPIVCPANNLTLYSPPSNASRQFLLLCGRDYHSGQGAIDLYNIETTTMGECINRCADEEACVGAGWGEYKGRRICWLKSKLGVTQRSDLWYFAVSDGGGGNAAA